MRQIERMVWIAIVGFLSGLLLFSITNHTVSKTSQVVKNRMSTSLLDIANTYLQKYYISPELLDYDQMMYGAIQGFYESTPDHYNTIFPPDTFSEFSSDISGKMVGIGMFFQKRLNHILSVIAVLAHSPAKQAGLQTDDEILSINQIPVDNLSMDEISKMMQGESNTYIILYVYRPSIQQYKTIRIQRKPFTVPSVYEDHTIAPHMAYIKISDFQDNTPEELVSILKHNNDYSHGIILDLRNNPGGQLDICCNIANMLLPIGKVIVHTQEREPRNDKTFYTEPSSFSLPENIHMVILVNSQTASAAEILAAALKDNQRAILIGTQTFGKGSIQSIFPVPHHGKTFGIKITVAHYLTPHNQKVDKKGITPDIIVNEPVVTPLEQANWDSLLDSRILPKELGNHYEKKLSSEIWNKIQKDMAEKHLYLPAALLIYVIEQEKNLVQGNIHGVIPEADPQLTRAIQYLKTKISP